MCYGAWDYGVACLVVDCECLVCGLLTVLICVVGVIVLFAFSCCLLVCVGWFASCWLGSLLGLLFCVVGYCWWFRLLIG